MHAHHAPYVLATHPRLPTFLVELAELAKAPQPRSLLRCAIGMYWVSTPSDASHVDMFRHKPGSTICLDIPAVIFISILHQGAALCIVDIHAQRVADTVKEFATKFKVA